MPKTSLASRKRCIILYHWLVYCCSLYTAHDLQVPDDDEGEAEISSKEEEFLAISQLHGVPASAPLALQLKAVEAEYHTLKDSGQTHKAEHVQSLHAWKSKKALQVHI